MPWRKVGLCWAGIDHPVEDVTVFIACVDGGGAEAGLVRAVDSTLRTATHEDKAWTLLGRRTGPALRGSERRDRRRGVHAAPACRVRLAGPELRPESEWEYISYPGGVYPARRVPVAELIVGDEPAVIVLFTHDPLLAARVAWPLWSDEQDGGLTRPIRHWWRRVPADPATVERDGYDDMWWPTPPGAPGAIPLVEFPLPFRR